MFLLKVQTTLLLVIILLVIRESGASASQLLGFKRLSHFDGISILPNVPHLHQSEVHNGKVECDMVCVSHPDCSIFAFNTITSLCKLYPPAVYRLNTVRKRYMTRRRGETYYAHVSDWCPVTKGFMLDRETGMCFYVSEGKETWSKARKACKDVGARLMILDDVDSQNKMIKILKYDPTITKEHIWIGGRDLNPCIFGDQKYKFHWVNGNEVVHYFWGGKQPNGQQYNEYCLGILRAVLYDRDCDDDYRFFCDIPN